MVGAVVAVAHLDGLRAEREGEHLVAETDAENRQVGLVEHVADHRHGVGASGCGVAGAVGQEHTVWVVRHDVIIGGRCRQYRHVATGRCEAAQDVALRAVIHCNHFMLCLCLRRVAVGPSPPHLIPLIGLRAGDVLGQVHAFQPGEIAGGGDECLNVEIAVGVMGQCCVRRALLADRAG